MSETCRLGPSVEVYTSARAELAALREEIARLQKMAVHSSNEGTHFYYKDAWEASQIEIARLRAAAELGLEYMRSLVAQSSDLRTTRFNEGESLIEQALSGSPSGLAVVSIERLKEIEWLYDFEKMETFCAVCQMAQKHGHAPDCWLHEAIQSAEKEAAQ